MTADDRPEPSGTNFDPAPVNQTPAADDSETRAVTEKPRRSRGRTAAVSALMGLVLVIGGLYLIGGFGPRVFDSAANAWVASTSDIALATLGAVCLFVAEVLDGWSPWATLLPGVILTGVGVWSVISADGAAWVVSIVDGAVGRSELILSGVHIIVLVIGLLLLGASAAVTIARSAGRSRGRA